MAKIGQDKAKLRESWDQNEAKKAQDNAKMRPEMAFR